MLEGGPLPGSRRQMTVKAARSKVARARSSTRELVACRSASRNRPGGHRRESPGKAVESAVERQVRIASMAARAGCSYGPCWAHLASSASAAAPAVLVVHGHVPDIVQLFRAAPQVEPMPQKTSVVSPSGSLGPQDASKRGCGLMHVWCRSNTRRSTTTATSERWNMRSRRSRATLLPSPRSSWWTAGPKRFRMRRDGRPLSDQKSGGAAGSNAKSDTPSAPARLEYHAWLVKSVFRSFPAVHRLSKYFRHSDGPSGTWQLCSSACGPIVPCPHISLATAQPAGPCPRAPR